MTLVIVRKMLIVHPEITGVYVNADLVIQATHMGLLVHQVRTVYTKVFSLIRIVLV